MMKDLNVEGEAINDMWLGDFSGNERKSLVWMGRG